MVLVGLAVVLLASHRRSRGPVDPLTSLHIEMTPQLAAELETNLKASFQSQIDLVTAKFANDLTISSQAISSQLGTVSTKVVDEEVAKFQKTLEQVRTTAAEAAEQLKQASQGSFDAVSKASADTMHGVQQTVSLTMKDLQSAASGTLARVAADAEAQSSGMHGAMASEVAAERKLLVSQFDARMADIVTAYLAEALGGGIDLGVQRDYVMKTLEARREDIKRDLLGEA